MWLYNQAFAIGHACFAGTCTSSPHSKFCGNYTQQLDSNHEDIIKGLILCEGSMTGAYEGAIFGEKLAQSDNSFLQFVSSGL